MFKRYLFENYKAFWRLKNWWARRVTRATWLVVMALFVTGAFGADTNLSVAYQGFAFLACLALAAFVSVFFNRVEVEVSRSLPRLCSAGVPFSYRLIIRNLQVRPQRFLRVRDELSDPRPTFQEFVSTPEPGEEKRNWYDRTYGYYRWQWLIEQNEQSLTSEYEVSILPPGSAVEVAAQLTPKRRGVMRFVGATIFVPDIFGIFRRVVKVRVSQSVVVLPKRYPMPSLTLPGMMKYQHGGVTLASSVGESEEFVALRDYRPGDPLRHIHWKSWAKAGKPIVKEFQDEFFVRHALILDTFTPVAHSEVFEEAVSAAASVAFTVQTQETLLDLMFVGPEAYCFTMGRGVGHTERILEVLAAVRPCQDKTFESLSKLVLEHATSLSGCICILIHWDESRRKFLERLEMAGIPLVVCLVAGGEKIGDIDRGPMSRHPENFHILRPGRMAEDLQKL